MKLEEATVNFFISDSITKKLDKEGIPREVQADWISDAIQLMIHERILVDWEEEIIDHVIENAQEK